MQGRGPTGACRLADAVQNCSPVAFDQAAPFYGLRRGGSSIAETHGMRSHKSADLPLASGVRRRRLIAPQRLAEILGEIRKHHVEADADPLLVARIRIDGVRQVGWKDEQRP